LTVEEIERVRHRGFRAVAILGRRHSLFAVWPARRVMLTGIASIDTRTRLNVTKDKVEGKVGGQFVWKIEGHKVLTLSMSSDKTHALVSSR
jgi:hypothetical protein